MQNNQQQQRQQAAKSAATGVVLATGHRDVSLCTTAEGTWADTWRDSWALNIFLVHVVPQVVASLAVLRTLYPAAPMMQLSKPKTAPRGSRGQVLHLRIV